jgi:hypothetical protein
MEEELCLVDSCTTNTVLREVKYFQTLTRKHGNVLTIAGSDATIVGSGKAIVVLPMGTQMGRIIVGHFPLQVSTKRLGRVRSDATQFCHRTPGTTTARATTPLGYNDAAATNSPSRRCDQIQVHLSAPSTSPPSSPAC